MLDITPTIHLPASSLRIYRALRFVLLALFIATAINIFYRVLFPVSQFSFDFSKSSALSNTIARPTDTPDGLVFDVSTSGFFDRARITVVTHAPRTFSHPISVYRGYSAQFYPQKSDGSLIEPSSSLLPGMLFERSGGIWIVTDTTHIAAIADLETFLAKGWSFDDVRKDVSSDALTGYTKRKLFTLKDHHPDGTIFRSLNAGHLSYEMISSGTRIPLSQEALSTTYPRNPVVDVTPTSTTLSSSCMPTQSLFFWKKTTYTCTMDISKFSQLIGTDYHFIVPDTSSQNIRNITVTLYRTANSANARTTLSKIKQRLGDRY